MLGALAVAVVAGSISGPSEARIHGAEPAAVSFSSPRSGALATVDGRLLVTRDAGRHWTRVGPRRPFAAIDFATPRRGWALTADRTLLATADGGRSWRRLRRFPDTRARAFSTTVDRLHGVVTIGGRLYRSTDEGRSWRHLRFWCPVVLGGVAFRDARHGLAVCGGQGATIEQVKKLFATADGGRTWRLVRAALPPMGFVGGLAFPGHRVGYLTAARAGIYRTTDGGRHWRLALFGGEAFEVGAGSWPDAAHGFAVVGYSGLIATADGGRHWRRVYPARIPTPQGELLFSSARTGIGASTGGILGSGGTLLGTSDGGRSWRPLARLRSGSVRQLVRSAPGIVWATTSPGGGGPCRLLRSRDGGRTWRHVLTTPGDCDSLSFPTATDGVLSSGTRLLTTRNGGKTWVGRGIGFTAYRIAFVSPRVGFASDGDGLRRTGDGGRTWSRVVVPAIDPEALVARSGHVWAAGAHGLLRSTDAGRTWQLVKLPRDVGQGGIDFVSARLGYFDDPGSGVYRTTDGGRTWRFVR